MALLNNSVDEVMLLIELAVRNAIKESLEDIESVIKESIVAGLSEYEYKKQNK